MESPQFLAEKLLAWGAIGGGRPIARHSLSKIQSSAFSLAPPPPPQAHLTCPIKAAGASQEARPLLPLLGVGAGWLKGEPSSYAAMGRHL